MREAGGVCFQRKGQLRTQMGGDICSTRRRASRETNPSNTGILDFQPPNSEDMNPCCSKKSKGLSIVMRGGPNL